MKQQWVNNNKILKLYKRVTQTSFIKCGFNAVCGMSPHTAYAAAYMDFYAELYMQIKKNDKIKYTIIEP